jgi:predicted RNase H-like HicB family nuclease
MTELERVLVNRDGITLEEARRQIKEVKEMILSGEERLEDALLDYLGVEPDYIFDVLI